MSERTCHHCGQPALPAAEWCTACGAHLPLPVAREARTASHGASDGPHVGIAQPDWSTPDWGPPPDPSSPLPRPEGQPHEPAAAPEWQQPASIWSPEGAAATGGSPGTTSAPGPDAGPWANQAPTSYPQHFAPPPPTTPGGGWAPPEGYAGWSLPPSPPGKDTRPKRPLVLAAILVVAVLATAAAAVVLRPHDDGPKHPGQWDPRVAPIAAWVAKERKLEFKQPVYVDFLTAAQYTKATAGDGPKPTAAERAQANQYVAAYRALGLVKGNHDLYAVNDTTQDVGSLAFYDPITERITVRGSKLTPGLRVTLAHELTHVLQDQYFNLKSLEDPPDPSDPTGYDNQVRAVAEGDATRIEDAYVKDELTAAERKTYEADSEGESDDATEKLADTVPDIFTALFGAPYVFGPRFVDLLVQEKGAAAVDEAIQIPPSSEEQIMDPISYLDGERVQQVDAPELPVGATAIERSTFGSIQWFLMLAERLPPGQALAAANGWGGDASLVYSLKGKVCVSARFSGDSPTDDRQMATALKAWARTMPEGVAHSDSGGGVESFTSCDPGADTTKGVVGRSQDVLVFPAVRNDAEAAALKQHKSHTEARCYADFVVTRLTLAQLDDDTGAAARSPGFQLILAAGRANCF